MDAPSQTLSLENIPLFKGLNEIDRGVLTTMLERHEVPSGKLLFHVGDPGDSLFIIGEGEVEIFLSDHTGEKVVLGTNTVGDIFGELSLLDQGPRTASVLAITDCILYSLNRTQLIMFLHGRPDAALSLMRVISQRLRQANQLIQARTTKNFNKQIEKKLTFFHRGAFKAAALAGSFSFLLLHVLIFVIWLLINIDFFPDIAIFDPPPFSMLSFLVSIEAIFLSIIVLFAQNVEAASDKIKNDIEYDVNLRAEQEVTHLHEKIDHLRAEILARLNRLEHGTRR